MYLPENKNDDFEQPPPGNHLAVCYAVVDLGTQTTVYSGKPKDQRKIWIAWELPDEKTEAGAPCIIGCRYTFSSYKGAKLRQHLESWRGKRFEESDFGEGGFNIANIIGTGCMLNILHAERDGTIYANVDGVSRLPKGKQPPALTNERVYFSLDEFDEVAFGQLSERLQATVCKSPEYAAIVKGKTGSNEAAHAYDPPEDDIPF